MATKRDTSEAFCIGCNRLRSKKEFNLSPNPNHKAGVLPYCKSCCTEIFKSNLKKLGSFQASLWATLAEVGVPYREAVADRVIESVAAKELSEQKLLASGMNHVGNYMRYFTALKKANDKWETFIDSDRQMDSLESIQARKQRMQAEVDKFKLAWGDFELEDYAFLEYRYDIYTDGLALKPAQETLYRKLCIAELSARKIEAEGESTKEIQKQILDLMGKLKIDNFAEVKDKNLVEQMLESQIYQHERTKPMEFYDEKELYEDACGLKNGWSEIKRGLFNFVLGHKEYPKIREDAESGSVIFEEGDS